jgi:hypothetical protein
VVEYPAPSKCFPVIVTVVAPVVGPFAGLKLTRVGIGLTNVKDVGRVTVPWLVSTETETVPSACAGATTCSFEVVVSWIDALEVVPNSTLVTAVRWEPLIVTVVPPVTIPFAGVTDVIVGAGVT